jgi:hypothetical protein
MAESYYHIRYRWWTKVDLEELEGELFQEYRVVKHGLPPQELELTLHKDDRIELIVKSDTLTATISGIRAYITQKESAPFTSKDMKLRKKVIDLFPRTRPSPLPVMFHKEPKFEVAEDES